MVYLYSSTVVAPALSQLTACCTHSPVPKQQPHSVSWISSIWREELWPETGRIRTPSYVSQNPSQRVSVMSSVDLHLSPSDVLNDRRVVSGCRWHGIGGRSTVTHYWLSSAAASETVKGSSARFTKNFRTKLEKPKKILRKMRFPKNPKN